MDNLNVYLPYIVIFALIIFDKLELFMVLRVLREALQRAQDHVTATTTPVVFPPEPMPIKPVPIKPVPAPTPAPHSDVVVDEKFLAFVRAQEGFTPKAFWDYKQWTNGHGTKAASATEVIDKDEAEKRLVAEATAAAAFVKSKFPLIPVGVEQAMIDFTFNLGEKWVDEPIGHAIASLDFAAAKEHMMQYVHAGRPPVVLDALVKRRTAEVNMFDHPL